jgi:hypothetical protein
MDSWHPDIRQALRMQQASPRVEAYGGVELDASRIAKRKWLFQLIENQPIGTVEKVIAMQRVMDALIVEQMEFDKLDTARP